MALIYRHSLQQNARNLRKQMTDAEMRLWSRIRRRQLNGYQFYRQRVIGSYIVDFFCPRARLVIELDGGQHYYGRKAVEDKTRDADLRSIGLTVLRFSDSDALNNMDSVLEVILGNLPETEGKSPLIPLFTKGEAD